MKSRSSRWLYSAAASIALLTGGIAARAQDTGDEAAPPPPPPPPAAAGMTPGDAPPPPPAPGAPGGFRNRGGGVGRFNGQVAAVTATGFTYTARRTNATITVAVTPQTTYTVTHQGTVDSVKTGDKVTMIGQSDPTAKTVQAFMIMDGATPETGAPRRGGFGGFAPITGTVVSTSPLKVKDAQGVVYSVTPAGQGGVTFSAAGTIKDVQVGKYVTVRPQSADGATVSPAATAITAETVVISPTAPRYGGRGGGAGRPGGGGFGRPGGGGGFGGGAAGN